MIRFKDHVLCNQISVLLRSRQQPHTTVSQRCCITMLQSWTTITMGLVICSCVHAQVRLPGTCQNVTLQQNFDVSKYSGVWYEQKRYPARFQSFGKCVTATYTKNENGTVGVRNAMINSTTNEASSVNGYAVLDGMTGEGKLLVSFPASRRPGQYWILGTDYNNYSVVWSCYQVSPEETFQMAWVLTRSQKASEDAMNSAQNIISVNNLAPKFMDTDQDNCP